MSDSWKKTSQSKFTLPVGVEARRGGESLLADVADVRLLAGVRPHVPLQQTRPVERLAAHAARQHRLATARPRIDAMKLLDL